MTSLTSSKFLILNGDIFDFESYIEKCLSELPPINITPFDINSVFNLSLLNRKKA